MRQHASHLDCRATIDAPPMAHRCSGGNASLSRRPACERQNAVTKPNLYSRAVRLAWRLVGDPPRADVPRWRSNPGLLAMALQHHSNSPGTPVNVAGEPARRSPVPLTLAAEILARDRR